MNQAIFNQVSQKILLIIGLFFIPGVLTVKAAELSEGEKLLSAHCLSCHGPSSTAENRIAPPMIAVKKHYMRGNPSLEKFVKGITQFVLNPDARHTKMPGAVKRFGLMPNLNFDEKIVTKIATHIYTETLDKPDWFEAHYQNQHSNKRDKGNDDTTKKTNHKNIEQVKKQTALEKGRAYANSAQAILGKNLIKTINTQGPIAALDFCHVNAIPLTVGSHASDEVLIKRVSDKNRNPANVANARELSIIKEFKANLKNGIKITPKVFEGYASTQAYYPIVTKGLCLQCHGKPNQDISSAVYQRITQLYPNDKAIDYQANNLRGLWVIEMMNK